MFKCFTKSFIKSYVLKKIKRFIISLFYYINILISKDKNKIVAFVDFEVINDKLVPYKNDNVYLLSEYIKLQNKNIIIIYIPSNQFGGKKEISIKNKILFFMDIMKAKVLLYKQPPDLMGGLFTNKQFIISLGYFIPFKADYWDFAQWQVFYKQIFNKSVEVGSCSVYREEVLKHFTYRDGQFKKTNLAYITPSLYASNVISKSHNLPIDSFKVLGLPKGDLLQESRSIDFTILYNLDFIPKKVFFYTPTFRDIYIRKSFDSVEGIDRSIFCYENEKEELEDFLIDNDILIVLKLHKSFPFYREMETNLMNDDKSYFKNCYFLDFEIEAKYDLSIYNLFELSDAMIADYSSISFDYLPYGKPIIYNIPDIEEYRDYRGFSYEPIEDMMPGEKVKTIDEFKKALLNISKSKDDFKKDREQVLSMVNEVPRGKALSNIYKYVEEIID